MNENLNANTAQKEFEEGRNNARLFAMLVYGGVVVAVTTLFISFVLSAFPQNAYLSRFIMTTAGVLIGCSMIAFPVALHKWAIEKKHRQWTIALYFGEMIFIAANTITSFGVLLSKYAGTSPSEWVVLYEPFSILAVIYTLAAWGIVFLLDPSHKSKTKELEAMQTFNDSVSQKVNEFVNSAQGLAVIQHAATKKIERIFDKENFETSPKDFYTGQGVGNVRQYDYLMPPHGDRQHPDLVFARIPSDEFHRITQAWQDYDNIRTLEIQRNGNNSHPTAGEGSR